MVICTKTTRFHHRHAYISSIIGPIMTTSGLPIVCGNYKIYFVFYKIFYKWSLNFGLPGVWPEKTWHASFAFKTHLVKGKKYLNYILCVTRVTFQIFKVEHRYTVGAIFPYRTRTCTHRNLSRVYLYLDRNSRGVMQYLWYPQFIFIKICYVHIYM